MDKIINVSELIEKYDIPFMERHREVYSEYGVQPKLAVILTSDDPGSISYTKGIKRFCSANGVECEDFTTNSTEELKELICKLNDDKDIDGMMVMYPTPYQENDTVFMNMINPAKDVEGLHNTYLGYLAQFEKTRAGDNLRKHVIPPTAKGILYIIKRYYELFEKHKEEHEYYPDGKQSNPFSVEGRHFTIINDSLAVGRSLALMLLNENGSVQICHKYTPYYDILGYIRTSDFIISAVPSSQFVIPTDAVSENAIVIDISFEGNFEYPGIIDKCYKIAPRWDLTKKGNRINDITLYRLISNLFYLVNSKQSDELIKKIEA
jgi:5,10-methylene-tetrahydrofolate dehydrogenase/methenyl tetrahydrofolate cyclohydrolase